MTETDKRYMARCLELAAQGLGRVAPNPVVGAVLVHGDRIIGEGYHMQYGEAHAEVNCINAVRPEDRGLIAASTLYVSLEPCAHHGKTPPCSDLIIRMNIPRIVVGCRDPFSEVNGKGIEKLRAAGREVIEGVLEQECRRINKRFFCFHMKHRPYIVLKWAQTADGFAGCGDKDMRLKISSPETDRMVHKWRSEEAGIMVGTNTALMDNPSLDNRLWTGKSPVRVVLDQALRLPRQLNIFNGMQPTIILNNIRDEEEGNLLLVKLRGDGSVVEQIVATCHAMQLQSILVEGGPRLLQAFIAEGLWDEARIITGTKIFSREGLKAPELHAQKTGSEQCGPDIIDWYEPQTAF
jgi:diaminohydroxyphosphoribosylaminopyrimidine deaminase/5-amino-6-(5-phosphoribosylamino)uracil reductase